MSIYASTLGFDNEEHDCETCERWVECSEKEAEKSGHAAFGVNGMCWRWVGENACTCGGDDKAPLLYHGSHVYPDSAKRGGHLDFGVIPGHIADGGGYDEAHEHWTIACHRPFLRIGFSDPFGDEYPDRHAPPTSGTLVLDQGQVIELRDYLNDFLDRITSPKCFEQETPEEAKSGLDAFIATAKSEGG